MSHTRLRRGVQGGFAALFLAMPILALPWLGGTAIALRAGPLELVEPTSVVSATLASGALALAAVVAALPFVLATVAFGSVFCAWMCPYGFLSEGLDRVRRGHGARWAGEPWKRARAPRLASLGAVLAGSLVLGVPLVAALAPPRLLTALPIEARALAGVPWVTATLVLAVLVLDLALSRRIVCRALCPVGAGLALARAPFTWTPRYERARCSCPATPACLTACKWGLDPRRMSRWDGCTACLACIEHCPSGALQLRSPPRSSNQENT